ncbi:MAG: class I SAM-dependent methyltransferase [Candidatus Hodarchaeales archaeon]
MNNDNKTYRKSAKYYDTLYNWKDYQKEVNNFLSFSQNILNRPLTTLLDLGCGTGNHALKFSRQGISVVGVDLSQEQIEIAKEKATKENLNIKFIVSDMLELQLSSRFDVGTIFFGGFGYLLTDKKVIQLLNITRNLISPGGFFFFEFFHTLGVKPDTDHNLIVENGKTKIIRFNLSKFNIGTGIITFPMKHYIIKESMLIDEFTETHQIRTYTIPLLTSLVNQSSWDSIDVYRSIDANIADRKPQWEDFRLYAVLK